MKPFDVYPLQKITPVKATGTRLWDDKGVEYLDFYGGHAVISVGHSHPVYVEAIQKQLDNLGFYSNSVLNPLQIELAERLGIISGYPDYQLFLVNSGSEAVENALRLASFHTGRKKVVAFHGAFHGRTSGSLAVTDNRKYRSAFNVDHEVAFVPLNDPEAVTSQLEAGDVAAVLIEGIQGMAGVLEPSDDFLQFLETECAKHGTMLVLDEVQSGFGRTGKFFAHQHAAIRPQLITMGKGMGNGFPVGGVMIHPDIRPEMGMLGATFGGNHLACTAVLSVLKAMIAENMMQQAEITGAYAKSKLASLQGIKEARGRGLMLGIEFAFPVKQLRKLLLDEGILTGNSSNPNVLRILPPLCITIDEVDMLIEKLEFVLMKISIGVPENSPPWRG